MVRAAPKVSAFVRLAGRWRLIAPCGCVDILNNYRAFNEISREAGALGF